MVQPNRRSEDERSQPYLRAAHVQPNGVLDFSVEEKPMWFSAREVMNLDLRRGDVVVVEGGAGCGRAAFLRNDLHGWGFQNSIVRLRPYPDRSEGRFLTYCLLASLSSGAIEIATSTATLPHFTAEKVGRFRVPHLSLSQQSASADYLDRETAEIDTMDAELDHLVRTLVERRSWVGNAAFRGLEVESVLMQYVADVTVGIVIEPSKLYVQHPQGVPALRGLNVGPGFIRDADVVHISDAGHALHAKSQLSEGDLVTVRTGQVGVTAMVPASWNGANAIDLVITRPHEGLDPHFLYWFLTSDDTMLLMDSQKVGSVQAHFNVGAMKRLSVPLPPLAEQRRIVAELDEQTARIDDMIADAQRLKALLAERRATLITEVVTGRKEVPAP
ncbi:restriction endonuclease subunit S [Ammonicoccus fulvus]|uniref:Restriction endonuclease subunit S n=1 Tax=Ammonicoccus fulvus TaxID=3138240 RepID=A0ABZ3FP65_9ACTN